MACKRSGVLGLPGLRCACVTRRGHWSALVAWIRARGTGVVTMPGEQETASGPRRWSFLACYGGPAAGLARGLPRGLRVFGREGGGGALVAVGLADVPGPEDALVADAEEAGPPQRERGYARQAAPAAGDAGGGGVLDGGEGPLGAGAPCVGAAVLGGGVVVLLPGLGRDLGGDGDGLLGAAGRRVLGRGQDLRAGAV